MSLQAAWGEILAFNDRHYSNWRGVWPIYFSNALAGEAGSVCNALKHLEGGGTHKVRTTPADVIEQVVDTLIYAVLLAERLGFNEAMFRQAFNRKMRLNEERLSRSEP